jgi:signal transduction histidine kinase
MYSDASGPIWLGTNRGLVKYQDGRKTVYTTANGLSDTSLSAIAADREDNLWLGTNDNGLSKLSNEQIASFTRTEGLPDFNVHNIFESRSGTVYAFSFTCCAVKLTDSKVEQVPGSESQLFNALWNGQVFLDHEGNRWFVTASGLYRFRGPELAFRHGEKMNAVLGIPEQTNLSVMFETADKRIWLSTWEGVLYQLELSSRPRIVKKLVLSDLNPTFTENPIAMLSDNRGTLWFATRNQGLGRLIEGKLERVEPTEGLPETAGRSLFQDSRGWIWIGLRNEGVSVLKDPGAEPLRFVNYSTAQKLASDSVWSITEDNFGRIYLGTGKGLAQIDPGTGRTRILTTADGLVGDNINLCFKDSQGRIWITTNNGVSRLSPRPPGPPLPPPPVYLNSVYVAGDELALPERGLQRLPYFELASSRNNLTIEYEAVNFRSGTLIRYQYKLDGVDADWSAATDQRTVNFARLAPGTYRFLVRAINEAGLTSGPAQIDFRILPPLYLRWWFIAVVVTVLALTAYLLFHLRVKRLVEIERVRTRIATDLHDDVGANASLIAMLSEVAQQQAAQGNAKAFESLASIAGTARELIDSTSDIVWAVNPEKDRASELIKRMRRFASDALGARGVRVRFAAPMDDHDFRLGADARREIYFVFKESVNNIARHAECSEAEITLSVEAGHLVLKLSDNGKGFDTAAEFEGNGLKSMCARALKLDAEFSVVSHPGSGCETRLEVPLRHGRFHL